MNLGDCIMSDIPYKYKKLHQLCLENQELLEKTKNCACFYCLYRFDVSEIEEWIEDEYGLSAICPSCGIDTVIPIGIEIDGEIITYEEVKMLKKYYFD